MKPMRLLVLWFVAAFAVTVAAGCASSRDQSPGYATVSEPPRRNSAAAQEHHAKAISLLEAGKRTEAEAELKRALEADLMHGPAHNNLGKVYFDQKQLYLAAWEFQYASQLMPHHSEPRNNLAMVLEASGQLDAAVEQYTKALELAPDHPQIIGNLARARLRRGDAPKEVKDLLQQLALKDTRPEWIEWAREKLSTIPE